MDSLKKIVAKHPTIKKLAEKLLTENKEKFFLENLIGSSLSFILYTTYTTNKNTKLVILNEKEEAAYIYNDLINIFGTDSFIFYFPSSHKHSLEAGQKDKSNLILRTEALAQLATKEKHPIIITYPEAITEKVTSTDLFKDNTIELKLKSNYSIDFIVELLEELGFNNTDFVYEVGEYSVRGSIIDVFSYANDYPYRIDFLGDQVNSIRTFEIDTQLSIERTDQIAIIPEYKSNNKISLFDFIDPKIELWLANKDLIADRIDTIFNHLIFEKKEKEIISKNIFLEVTEKFKLISFGKLNFHKPNNVIPFKFSPQPNFNKNFNLLADDLKLHEEQGYKKFILSDNPKQLERIKDIFTDRELNIDFIPIEKTIHKGFIDHDLRICVYTDHQIFGRFHKYQLKSKHPREGKAAQLIKQINELQIGDFIVHQDHGIGIFSGLEKMKKGGTTQEAIKLTYKNNDLLYIGLHSLHKISKYRGKESATPKINKLGTGAWQKLKTRAKGKIKDIAKDLIALYAKRKTARGFSFSGDTYLQQELEASFIYEDTPDQTQTTKLVKQAMEANFPMDCLVCGDVGFGKTEIAIRAAFKAITDNKQVAILVPTTILALQHYKTFSDRLKKFPCNVDYISRLRPAKEIKKTINDIKTGKVDIIIGTHRIVGKDIHFKDLGLFIVDEEQKFGVTMKEKLKNLKENVDTLTLTATPIPRTLQFSLMGIRDLSIIKTPPPNRFPIVTEVQPFNKDKIREAVLFEIERGGQVYFVHNRVQTIYEIQKLFTQILPQIRTVVAHGQMEGNILEKTILNFIDGDYDVLIATSIIESGVDISNVNTIIIDQAQNFGLSDLHQLRGRVGRTNKRAYCYLLSPPINTLTSEATRRMKTIQEFSELGSGFNIALQDLDIRGAGNLLGAEQNGFITEIGYETYHKILDEAITELKETHFKHLYDTDKETKFAKDCQVETDLEILFPDNYINSANERIRLYRQLDNIKTYDELNNFKNTLIDRFGEIPPQAQGLIDIVKLRWIAIKISIERINIKNNIMINFFASDTNSNFNQTEYFKDILTFIQKNPRRCKLKQKNDKLILEIVKIENIPQTIDILKKMIKKTYGN